MPAALSLLNRGAALIARAFGTTAYTIETVTPAAGVATFAGHWNALGKRETLELAGRRVSFSELVETPRSQFAGGTPPRHGLKVTRTSDGAVFRIVGEVQADELTIRFPLESVHQ